MLPRDLGARRHGDTRQRSSIGAASAPRGSSPPTWGFVPREDSSGDRERKGTITKAGNAYCRHALIQAAWSYRYVPKVAAHRKKRQMGQPAGVIAHAWKAQQRLQKRYVHLAYRKQPQVAVVAVARELIGFLWAVMQELTPPPMSEAPVPAT